MRPEPAADLLGCPLRQSTSFWITCASRCAAPWGRHCSCSDLVARSLGETGRRWGVETLDSYPFLDWAHQPFMVIRGLCCWKLRDFGVCGVEADNAFVFGTDVADAVLVPVRSRCKSEGRGQVEVGDVGTCDVHERIAATKSWIDVNNVWDAVFGDEHIDVNAAANTQSGVERGR